MPSTNVIAFTLVLFLKQEVIKYHQIFMLRGDFFRVWIIISWFVNIAVNSLKRVLWFFANSSISWFGEICFRSIHCIIIGFQKHFITVFKNSHYHLFWQLSFKTIFQNFILWLKQTFTKNWQFWIVQPVGLKQKVQQKCCFSTTWLSSNQALKLWGKRGWLLLFAMCSFHQRFLISIYLIKAFNKWINYIVSNIVILRKRETWNRKQQKTTVRCFKASVLFVEGKSQNLLTQVEKGLTMTQLILYHLKWTCQVTTSQDQARNWTNVWMRIWHQRHGQNQLTESKRQLITMTFVM